MEAKYIQAIKAGIIGRVIRVTGLTSRDIKTILAENNM